MPLSGGLNDGDKNSNGADGSNSDDKVTPPLVIMPLRGLVAATGAASGEVVVSWELPESVEAYAKMVLVRVPGAGVDEAACADKSKVVHTFEPPFTESEYRDQTGSIDGGVFSYALCAFDAAGEVIASKLVEGVTAADTTAPLALTSFIGATGTNQAEVSLSLGWLADLGDLSEIRIVMAVGSTAPADCASGTVVYQKTSNFNDASVVVPTGQNEGQPVSFRVCTKDQWGNTDTSHTIVGVTPLDVVPPPQLAALTVVPAASAASITYDLTLPTPATDVARVDLRTMADMLPSAGCADGTLLASFSAPFGASIQGDLFAFGQDDFGFRVCIYDSTGNLTDADTVAPFYVPGCDAGHYSNGAACIAVGPGFYSLADDNTRSSCDVGRYCATSTNGAGLGDGPCDAGYYCPVGSSSQTAEDAGAGKYTGTGAAARLDCAVGRYCQSLNNVDDQGDGPCDPGYFCPAGSSSQFQENAGAGKYTGIGAVARLDCAAGRFCQTLNNDDDQGDGPCDPGYFCPAGSTSSTGGGQCDPGYYCPAGSAVATAQNCPTGSFCVAGSGAPSACTNKPEYSAYTTPNWATATCPWSCNGGHTEVAGQCLPNCVINTGPAALTTSASAAFTMTCTNIGNVQCSLDGGAYANCNTPSTHSVAGLAAGAHTMRVRSTNGTTVTGDYDEWSWTVDATPPTVNITTATIVDFSASFVFSHSDPQGPIASVECRLNAGAWGACTTSTTMNYGATIGQGAQTFYVRVTDTAGNQATTSHAWNTGAWYQADLQVCSTFCSNIGRTNVQNVDGARCASGEIRPPNISGITWTYGTWGGNCVPGTASCNKSNNGAYCYGADQGQDADGTDLSVACYCR